MDFSPFQCVVDYLRHLPIAWDAYIAIFAGDLARYLIAAGLAYFLLYRVFKVWAAPRKLGPRPNKGQISREIRLSLLTVLIFASNGYLIFYLIEHNVIDIYDQVGQYGWAYWVFTVILLVGAHDAYFYAVHRFLHRPWWFTHVHRWHHRSVHPTPWAAYAFHPIEAILMAVFLPLMLLLFPLHSSSIFIFLVAMIGRNVIGHSGIELTPNGAIGRFYARFFASTVHHHHHHQFSRGNYGLYFRYLDQLFDTERANYEQAISHYVDRPRLSASVKTLG